MCIQLLRGFDSLGTRETPAQGLLLRAFHSTGTRETPAQGPEDMSQFTDKKDRAAFWAVAQDLSRGVFASLSYVLAYLLARVLWSTAVHVFFDGSSASYAFHITDGAYVVSACEAVAFASERARHSSRQRRSSLCERPRSEFLCRSCSNQLLSVYWIA